MPASEADNSWLLRDQKWHFSWFSLWGRQNRLPPYQNVIFRLILHHQCHYWTMKYCPKIELVHSCFGKMLKNIYFLQLTQNPNTQMWYGCERFVAKNFMYCFFLQLFLFLLRCGVLLWISGGEWFFGWLLYGKVSLVGYAYGVLWFCEYLVEISYIGWLWYGIVTLVRFGFVKFAWWCTSRGEQLCWMALGNRCRQHLHAPAKSCPRRISFDSERWSCTLMKEKQSSYLCLPILPELPFLFLSSLVSVLMRSIFSISPTVGCIRGHPLPW